MKPTDNIPEGLEYKPEYWDAALNQIKRKESQMLWYRMLGVSLALLLIVVAIGWQKQQKKSIADHYHRGQSEIFASSSPLSENFAKGNEQTIAESTLNQNEQLNSKNTEGSLLIANPDHSNSVALPTENSNPIDETSNEFKTVNHKSILQTSAEAGNYTKPIDQTDIISNVFGAALKESSIDPIKAQLTELDQGLNATPHLSRASKTDDQSIAKIEGKNRLESTEKDTFSDIAFAAATPKGSPLESSNTKKIDWSIAPAFLLSKTAGEIPKNSKNRIEPIILGNLESLAQSFPIPHYSIQLVLGNGFQSQFGSRINGASFQPIVGLAYDYNLNRKWSLKLQGNYSQVDRVLRSIERTDNQLDYTLRSQTTLLKTTDLHFLNLPVQIARRIGDRHQIYTGLGISYLLTTYNTLQVNTLTSFESEQGEEQKEQGYTQGWQTFSTFGLIGYSYYLKPSTSISVSYHYGLSDMTNNAEFIESAFDRNSQLNLTLNLNLIER